jgi:hypothetical protein
MHRSLLHLVLAVLCVTVPACDRDEPTPAAGDAKPAADTKLAADAKTAVGDTKAEPGSCDAAHGKALEAELLAQCAVMPNVLEMDVPAAPWKAMSSPAPEHALQIDVSPKGVVLGGYGEPIAIEALSPDHLAEERDRIVEMAATYGRPRPEGWVLAIDRKTARLGVAKVLRALDGAGMRQGQLRLGTDSPGPLPVPRDPKLLAEIAARITEGDPSQKAILLAQELEKVVSACPPAMEAFSVAAAHSPDERCTLMARDLSQALVRCSCAKEAEILTLMHAVSVGFEPTVRLGISVPVTLDPTAAPLPGETWSEVVANLDQSKLALWVSPS